MSISGRISAVVRLLVILGFLLAFACQREILETRSKSVQFFALDTPCSITLQDYVFNSVFVDIEAEVRRIESLMSSYRDDSEVGLLNKTGQNILSPETFGLLQRALNYAAESAGLFDPSIGPLSQLWDITGSWALKRYEDKLRTSGKLAAGANLSSDVSGDQQFYQVDGAIASQIRNERQPPSKQSVANALSLVSYRNVVLDAAIYRANFLKLGMKLDLGGIAKGFTADRIAAILTTASAPAGVIDLGGNILLYGVKDSGDPWSVGVRGEGDSYLVGMFIFEPKAVVTSGIYQRYYMYQGKRYHHILSTETGYPVDNGIFSVTVVTDNSADADALATLLYIYGADRGMADVAQRQSEGENIETLFITESREVYASKGMTLLSDEQYNAIKNGNASSRDLDHDQIWLFPLQKGLTFINR